MRGYGSDHQNQRNRGTAYGLTPNLNFRTLIFSKRRISTPMPISLNPDTFVSGAIIDNVNATLINVRYGRFTYPGTSTTVVAALGYLMVDGDSQEHEQPWSIGGKPEDWIISEDGRFIESATGKSALQNNANLTMFLQELVNGGFPKNK